MTDTAGLIQRAEDYLAKQKIYEARPNQRKRVKDPVVAATSLEDLRVAAESGASIPELANFLRHQMSRGRDGWPHRKSGDALVRVLEKDLAPLAGDDPTVVARFLGYLIRHYHYRCLGAGTHARDR